MLHTLLLLQDEVKPQQTTVAPYFCIQKGYLLYRTIKCLVLEQKLRTVVNVSLLCLLKRQLFAS